MNMNIKGINNLIKNVYSSCVLISQGEFEDNKIQGKGLLEWQDSAWYEGEFQDGYRHGKGTMVDKNYNLLYIGHWYKGHKHGKGFVLLVESTKRYNQVIFKKITFINCVCQKVLSI